MLRKPRRPVPRALRIVNVAAGLLFLVGAAVYVRAWLGLRELQEFQPSADGPAFAAMARFDELWQLSRLGIWLILVALAVGVLAAIAAVVVSRRAASSADGGDPDREGDAG